MRWCRLRVDPSQGERSSTAKPLAEAIAADPPESLLAKYRIVAFALVGSGRASRDRISWKHREPLGRLDRTSRPLAGTESCSKRSARVRGIAGRWTCRSRRRGGRRPPVTQLARGRVWRPSRLRPAFVIARASEAPLHSWARQSGSSPLPDRPSKWSERAAARGPTQWRPVRSSRCTGFKPGAWWYPIALMSAVASWLARAPMASLDRGSGRLTCLGGGRERR